MSKMSIRFYNDHEVRAIWDEVNSKWWFSVPDVLGAINDQENHQKNRNYWKYLKSQLKKEGNELVSATNRFKMQAPDGKMRMTDVVDLEGVALLANEIPNNRATAFLDWFTYSDNTIDGKSKKKAYAFWGSDLIDDKDIGTTKALQQIHAYIFGGLYDFADKIDDRDVFMKGIDYSYYYEEE